MSQEAWMCDAVRNTQAKELSAFQWKSEWVSEQEAACEKENQKMVEKILRGKKMKPRIQEAKVGQTESSHPESCEDEWA